MMLSTVVISVIIVIFLLHSTTVTADTLFIDKIGLKKNNSHLRRKNNDNNNSSNSHNKYALTNKILPDADDNSDDDEEHASKSQMITLTNNKTSSSEDKRNASAFALMDTNNYSNRGVPIVVRTVSSFFSSLLPITMASNRYFLMMSTAILKNHSISKSLMTLDELSKLLPGKALTLELDANQALARGTRLASYMSVLGRCVNFLAISCLLSYIYFPDDRSCLYHWNMTECESKMNIYNTESFCKWNEDELNCAFRPPSISVSNLAYSFSIISVLGGVLNTILDYCTNYYSEFYADKMRRIESKKRTIGATAQAAEAELGDLDGHV